MRILEEKGYLTHTQDGAKYVYRPAQPRPPVAQEALSRLMTTFFSGNPEQVVAALLSDEERQVTDEELDRMTALIEAARQRGNER